MQDYRDLDVWKVAMELVERTYVSTKTMPREELYGLTTQIRRAAVSIPTNIAEGANRNSRGEYRQFVGVACGSQAELDTLLAVAERVFPGVRFKSEIEISQRVGMMLTKLRQALK